METEATPLPNAAQLAAIDANLKSLDGDHTPNGVIVTALLGVAATFAGTGTLLDGISVRMDRDEDHNFAVIKIGKPEVFEKTFPAVPLFRPAGEAVAFVRGAIAGITGAANEPEVALNDYGNRFAVGDNGETIFESPVENEADAFVIGAFLAI